MLEIPKGEMNMKINENEWNKWMANLFEDDTIVLKAIKEQEHRIYVVVYNYKYYIYWRNCLHMGNFELHIKPTLKNTVVDEHFPQWASSMIMREFGVKYVNN